MLPEQKAEKLLDLVQEAAQTSHSSKQAYEAIILAVRNGNFDQKYIEGMEKVSEVIRQAEMAAEAAQAAVNASPTQANLERLAQAQKRLQFHLALGARALYAIQLKKGATKERWYGTSDIQGFEALKTVAHAAEQVSSVLQKMQSSELYPLYKEVYLNLLQGKDPSPAIRRLNAWATDKGKAIHIQRVRAINDALEDVNVLRLPMPEDERAEVNGDYINDCHTVFAEVDRAHDGFMPAEAKIAFKNALRKGELTIASRILEEVTYKTPGFLDSDVQYAEPSEMVNVQTIAALSSAFRSLQEKYPMNEALPPLPERRPSMDNEQSQLPPVPPKRPPTQASRPELSEQQRAAQRQREAKQKQEAQAAKEALANEVVGELEEIDAPNAESSLKTLTDKIMKGVYPKEELAFFRLHEAAGNRFLLDNVEDMLFDGGLYPSDGLISIIQEAKDACEIELEELQTEFPSTKLDIQGKTRLKKAVAWLNEYEDGLHGHLREIAELMQQGEIGGAQQLKEEFVNNLKILQQETNKDPNVTLPEEFQKVVGNAAIHMATVGQLMSRVQELEVKESTRQLHLKAQGVSDDASHTASEQPPEETELFGQKRAVVRDRLTSTRGIKGAGRRAVDAKKNKKRLSK